MRIEIVPRKQGYNVMSVTIYEKISEARCRSSTVFSVSIQNISMVHMRK